MSDLVADLRAAEIAGAGRRSRCGTCPHAGVMADLEDILTAMSDDGTFRPAIKRIFFKLKERHPDWRPTSPPALREHLDRHDHDRYEAYFARR